MRSGMAANSSGVLSSDCTMMDALRRWPGTAGIPPNWPAETSTLYARTASTTSLVVMLYLVSRSGSSQIRMAYWDPNASTSPTPGTRASDGWIWDAQ